MTTLEHPTISIGIAIPDTIDELLAQWDTINIELRGRKRKGWRRHHRTTLHTWNVPAPLPKLVTWDVNVDCHATHIRVNGNQVPLDHDLRMIAGDTLKLKVNP